MNRVRQQGQIQDGKYRIPTQKDANSKPRDINNRVAKHQALDQLRKKFDYRHQQNTDGMRSLGSRPKVADSEAQSPTTTTYKVGDRIEHNRFGRGRIMSVERWSNGDMLKVNFESVGEKNIIAKLAPIKRIE